MVKYTFLSVNDSNGVPSVIDSIEDVSIYSDELNDFFPNSPRGSSQFHTPSWYTNNDISIIVNDTEVSITFIDEGAGYRNSVGYYIYDTETPHKHKKGITDYVIVFPNASKPGSGGNLQTGSTVRLPYSWDDVVVSGITYATNPNYQFPSGKSIGFFIVSNGWRGNNTVRPNRSSIRYSNPAFNSEKTLLNRYHTVSVRSNDGDGILVGFEDLNRDRSSTDHDFNDLIMKINVDFSKIDTSNYVSVDTESHVTYYGFMCYEDVREDMGYECNHDYNDLVWKYIITETIDTNGNLTKLDLTYHFLNRGSGMFNHRIRFLGTFDDVNVTRQEIIADIVSPIQVETGISPNSIIISESTDNLLPPISGEFTNTENGWESQVAPMSSIRILIEWNTPVARSVQPSAFYYDYVVDVYSSNKYLYSIRTGEKYPTLEPYLTTRGVTEMEKILYMPDCRKYRITKEKRALFNSYKGFLRKLLHPDELNYVWWQNDMVDSRISQYIDNPERTWDTVFTA